MLPLMQFQQRGGPRASSQLSCLYPSVVPNCTMYRGSQMWAEGPRMLVFYRLYF